MKEQRQERKVMVININLGRKSALVALVMLMVAAVIALVPWEREQAAASPAVSTAPQLATEVRKYYLTYLGKLGNEATAACISGYHMASLWEILDSSNLEYAEELGPSVVRTRGDSAYGQTSGDAGWVRTGYDLNTSNNPGQANCNGWSSDSSSDFGTAVGRPPDWTQATQVGDWQVITSECDDHISVWCIED